MLRGRYHSLHEEIVRIQGSRRAGDLPTLGGSPASLPMPECNCRLLIARGYCVRMASSVELWFMPTVALPPVTGVPKTVPVAVAELLSDL